MRSLIQFFLGLAMVGSLYAVPIVPTSYSYSTGPYGYLDSGGELTNGLYNGMIEGPGGSLATPNADQWVGFGAYGAMTFNFASSVTIRNVTLDMAHWTAAAVYLPASVSINSVAYTVNVANYPNYSRAVLSFDNATGWTGNSLTIALNPVQGAQWQFLDEVTFNSATQVTPSTPPTNAVPDAGSTMALCALAIGGLFAARRRRA